MGNYWHVYPLNAEEADLLKSEGSSVPVDIGLATAPTPDQVFAVLRSFPEYRVRVRREELKGKKAVVLALTREDGSYAIRIRLLGVTSDDRPVGVFCFEYYRETEDLVRLVEKLAEVCGPQVLYHDSGCERSVLVAPNRP